MTFILQIRKLNFRKYKFRVQGTTTSSSRLGFGTRLFVVLTSLSICPAQHYLLSAWTTGLPHRKLMVLWCWLWSWTPCQSWARDTAALINLGRGGDWHTHPGGRFLPAYRAVCLRTSASLHCPHSRPVRAWCCMWFYVPHIVFSSNEMPCSDCGP